MTSSDRADLKKIVKISITNIFILPLIIADDIIEILLLADGRLYLAKIGHFPGVGETGRSWLCEGWTTTDQPACVPVCLLSYS